MWQGYISGPLGLLCCCSKSSGCDLLARNANSAAVGCFLPSFRITVIHYFYQIVTERPAVLLHPLCERCMTYLHCHSLLSMYLRPFELTDLGNLAAVQWQFAFSALQSSIDKAVQIIYYLTWGI